MPIYTAQYNYSGPDRMDITAKASSVLSPSWAMVTAYKDAEKTAGSCWNKTEAGIIMNTAKTFYTKVYLDMIEIKIGHNFEAFTRLLEYVKAYDVTFVCFCNLKTTNFCHRVLAAEYLRDKYNVIYKGERG